MDFISHGLWGTILFGRSDPKAFLWSLVVGIAPDVLSFGPYIVGTWFGIFPHPDWSEGRHPSPSEIPLFTHIAYNITHSLIVFVVVFSLLYHFRKKIFWPIGAWGFHILLDIPFHDAGFFPTPFLWPISSYTFDGVSWGHPYVFYPNIILLALCIFFFFLFPIGRALLRKKRFEKRDGIESQ